MKNQLCSNRPLPDSHHPSWDNRFFCSKTFAHGPSDHFSIDFPNKIKYWKNGARLNASVSNSAIEISFEFEKMNK
jgi:hypothetical protein